MLKKKQPRKQQKHLLRLKHNFVIKKLRHEQNNINDELLTKLYNDNIASSLQITGMNLGGDSVYGSAFVLRSGVVVTTWSLFIQFLSSSDFLYVNDFILLIA